MRQAPRSLPCWGAWLIGTAAYLVWFGQLQRVRLAMLSTWTSLAPVFGVTPRPSAASVAPGRCRRRPAAARRLAARCLVSGRRSWVWVPAMLVAVSGAAAVVVLPAVVARLAPAAAAAHAPARVTAMAVAGVHEHHPADKQDPDPVRSEEP